MPYKSVCWTYLSWDSPGTERLLSSGPEWNGTVVELLVFRNDVVGVGLSSAGHLGHAGVVSTVSTSSIVFVVGRSGGSDRCSGVMTA